MSIISAIKKIKNSKRVFFTTPSHSQGAVVPAIIKNLIGLKVFKADVSEVDGLDNLKNPQKCLLKAQQKASKIYDTKSSFYLVNGSSSGIVAAILSVLKENDKVLVARNAHESVYNGLVLTGACPIWFLPEWDEEFDVAKGITLDQIKTEYEKNPDIRALILTSPTYEGICSDIENIAKFCQEKDIIFIVDEAHGALFPFSEKLPKSAINLGADIVVHSLHKNASALNSCAILHIGKNSNINPEVVQRNLNLINTTSPSWILIASIEATIDFLYSNKGKKEIDNLIKNIEEFKNDNAIFDFLKTQNQDLTKLLLKKTNVNGEDLSTYLSKNNIEDELVTAKSVLCLCGIGTTKKKLKKLSKVLMKFPKKFVSSNMIILNSLFLPEQVFAPKQANFSNFKIIKSKDAVGEIIAENITPYPPCIPILIAGERIAENHLEFLEEYVKVIVE